MKIIPSNSGSFEKDFIEFIKVRRTAMGLSTVQVAKSIGVTRAAYARWEYGTAVMKIDKVDRVCRALGFTIQAFSKRRHDQTPMGVGKL